MFDNGAVADPADGSRRRAGAPLIAAAVLLATCLTGWLVWSSTEGSGGGQGAQRVLPAPSVPRSQPQPARSLPTSTALPLRGKVVVLDPGHNTNNRNHTTDIGRLVDIGTGRKACDTTGTATNSGYPEAAFTLDVARRARALLIKSGATVRLTQNGDRSFGPCVDERARIGNAAHADAAVSIHADGSAAGNRGFHVILPASVHMGIADTRAIVALSRRLGTDLKGQFAAASGAAPSNYIGGGTGLVVRGDLGGLNLSTVPKVFIECGNMRDPRDAALLTDPAWRQKAAEGIAKGVTQFLEGKG